MNSIKYDREGCLCEEVGMDGCLYKKSLPRQCRCQGIKGL